MKKIIAVAALLAVAAMFTGCGKDVSESSDFKAPTTAASTSETASESASDASSVPTETTSVTSETASASADTQETADISDLAGYWYVDGDYNLGWIHVSADGKYECFQPDGNRTDTGMIEYGAVDESGNKGYIFNSDLSDSVMSFTRSDDSNLNPVTEYEQHYVRLYGEGGLGDDGRGDDEVNSSADAFVGRWGSERAYITIEDKGDGTFRALVTWSSSAASHVEWDYPLVFDGENLVCDGNGIQTLVEYSSPDSEPDRKVVLENCSAKFELRPDGLFWNDLSEHSADDKIFIKT